MLDFKLILIKNVSCVIQLIRDELLVSFGSEYEHLPNTVDKQSYLKSML